MLTRFPLSGWRRQAHDPRDFHFQVSRRKLVALAPTVDVSAHMQKQLDQGKIGSCGPNTAAEIAMYDMTVQGLPVVVPSRLFLYWNTRALMGAQYVNEDSGVDNRTLMKALAQYGYCDESLWPYSDDPTTYRKKPSQSCYDAAVVNKIASYAAVPQNSSQMQGTLASGYPFMFGFNVYQQMMSDKAAATGVVEMPKGNSIGGHDVTFCGFTTVDQPGVKPGNKWPANTYKFRNHWMNDPKTPWGDGGYGYIPFDYAHDQNYSSDFWVINAVPGAEKPPVSGTVLQPGTYTLPGGVTLIVPK